jgi:hypothetical protein
VDSHHLPEGTHSLAPRPGSLGRLTFRNGPRGRTRTCNLSVLSGTPLHWATWARWCRVRDFHPNLSGLSGAPLVVGLTRYELVLPAGFSPATATFEASHSDNLSYGSEMGPMERLALSWGQCPAVYETAAVAAEPHRRNGGLPRIRTVFSPVKSRDFTIKVCNPIATRRRS